jgi:hypothetical protein
LRHLRDRVGRSHGASWFVLLGTAYVQHAPSDTPDSSCYLRDVTLGNARIDVEVQVLYSPLMHLAIQPWQKPRHTLHLALDTTMLWNCFCTGAPLKRNIKISAKIIGSGAYRPEILKRKYDRRDPAIMENKLPKPKAYQYTFCLFDKGGAT